jgi:DNA-binding MarR family transcriptional regulator
MKMTPATEDELRALAPWGTLLHDVARLLKRRFEDEARTYGLTLPQYRVLGQIARGDEVSQTSLAAAVDTDPMTLSGILDRLEKRGLIGRMPDPSDSRAKLVSVTPEGAELVNKARNVGRSLLTEALAGVPAQDQDALVRALGCIRDNLQGQSARARELQ